MGGCMLNKRVLRVSRAVSRRLVEQGAEAVFLFGSRVRGDAYEESDIDVHALGRGPHYRLERCEGFLVSVSWATVRQVRLTFRNPLEVGGVIPAWRNALITYDRNGVASALKCEAQNWRWELLGKQTDRWVAEEITGYAEEVHRLVGNLQLRRRSAAAVQRSLLAIYMARILGLHLRILYDTENQLWDLVSARMGAKWAQLQNEALGEDCQSFEETCRAALQLFVSAAREVKNLLNQRQYEVVAHACEIAQNSPV
jgi:hypothetical protein